MANGEALVCRIHEGASTLQWSIPKCRFASSGDFALRIAFCCADLGSPKDS